jgi:glycogen operon protein
MELLSFVQAVSEFYHSQAVFQRRRFFHGKSLRNGQKEITWLDPSGKEMSEDSWHASFSRALAVHMAGGPIDVDEYGEPIVGDHVLMLFNADCVNEVTFTLPAASTSEPWQRILDTSKELGGVDEQEPFEGKTYNVQPSSMVVFCAAVPVEDVETEAFVEPIAVGAQ